MKKQFVLCGTFLHTPVFGAVEFLEKGYMLIQDGKVGALLPKLKEEWKDLPFVDRSGRLIIPAYADMHLHAVQYVNRGLGYDKGLLEWLEAYTFPEERRFLEQDYADKVFRDLAEELWQGGSLFSCHYSNAALSTTARLFEMIKASGLCAFVGKTNMDSNGGCMTEESETSLRETGKFLSFGNDKVKPILTPRFAPSCTPRLMKELGEIAEEHDLPVQTHINETRPEIAWVKELFPEVKDYLDVYERFGLIRKDKTILAHAIYNTPDEILRMKEQRVLLAHCPASNSNIASGIMRVKELKEKGLSIGLGSDISGGDALFMNRAMEDALKVSKLLAAVENNEGHILSEIEALYLATKGGQEFFGEKGTFEPGANFHALVIDDSRHTKYRPLTPVERLQKWIYLGGPHLITERYLNGELLVFEKAREAYRNNPATYTLDEVERELGLV
jgi:guanine deaminase